MIIIIINGEEQHRRRATPEILIHQKIIQLEEREKFNQRKEQINKVRQSRRGKRSTRDLTELMATLQIQSLNAIITMQHCGIQALLICEVPQQTPSNVNSCNDTTRRLFNAAVLHH